MKKYFFAFSSVLIIFLFTGCNFNKSQYIRPKSKPSNNYYTNEIQEKLNNKESYTIKIFDLNVYKYYSVNEDEHSILPEFIESLNNENYGAEIEKELTHEYKLIIEFSNAKYIINAYNDKLISIHPWDGVYEEDIISMEGVSDYYNLYKFCEYIKKVSSGFEG
ncbi:DUF4883 family protein [Clostridium tertium]|uniref:DUF4883 family protein n=1 Tax=Clostridium tertium TaxID=1559 RepID=UPI0022E10734|nr:DUF4883 family protein [Clostridium tertium]